MFLKRLQESHSIEFEEIYFACPDIHGHAALTKFVIFTLEQILKTKNVVWLGDYVDRGLDSLGVVKALYSAIQRNSEWVALLGNHEEMFLQDMDFGTTPVTERNLIISCTGNQLAFCYRFFRKLPIYHEVENLIFVHGGIGQSFNKELKNIPKQELLWSYGVNRHYKGKTIVRGHSSVDSPTESSNSISCHTPLFYGARQFYISVIANNKFDRKLLGYLQIDLKSLDCELICI